MSNNAKISTQLGSDRRPTYPRCEAQPTEGTFDGENFISCGLEERENRSMYQIMESMVCILGTAQLGPWASKEPSNKFGMNCLKMLPCCSGRFHGAWISIRTRGEIANWFSQDGPIKEDKVSFFR